MDGWPGRGGAATGQYNPLAGRPLSADVYHWQKLPWLKAACQEAQLLGAAEVTTDHLELALIGEPRSLIGRSVP